MNKKLGLKIGVGLAVLVGGYFLVKLLWKKAVIKIKASLIASGKLVVSESSISISVTDSDTGVVVSTYEFNSNNMSYPMSNDPSSAYDNVAKLQTYLLFANADLVMPIDGRFGDITSEAVLNETEGLTDYGYDADDYDYETITQAYYDEVVIPELDYFVNNQ